MSAPDPRIVSATGMPSVTGMPPATRMRSATGMPPATGMPSATRMPSAPQADSSAGGPTPYDPLRLCIFATIALLGWLGGPVTLLAFATLGFVGYVRARRGGLTISKCFLRDTRLVLAYLATLIALAGVGIWWWVR